jgi:asparagine synthase (glutamine-hydrolysing)
MCGVAGIYAYSSSAAAVDRDELRAVRDHMAARGPDGAGEWFSDDGRVGLAHRRLSIIDLSEGGAQPKVSADGNVAISFHGEIYNYKQLRRELQSRGRVFTSESDTEVLLQLYEEHGTAMLGMLRGMFAFALWDSRKRAMLLVRDPFGIKPLYYANDGKTLRVASQVKALLRSPVDTRPEPAGHAGFFLWGSVPNPWTLYKGIRGLVPGHFLWVDERGAHELQPYCVISDVLADAAAQPARGTQEEALEQISAALRGSIDAHLVSDVPVGVFLSAGMDSTMIASIVADLGIQPRTLTLGFREYVGTANDEVPLAESIARQLNCKHSSVLVQRPDFISEREKIFAAMDQPSIDGINTWFVAKAAAEQGMKVALSGLGGDELFGAYSSFRDVPRIQRLMRPLSGGKGLGRLTRMLSSHFFRSIGLPKHAGLIEYGGSIAGAYLLKRGLYMPWELGRVMDPEMAKAGLHDLATLAGLGDTVSRMSDRSGRLAVSALEMSWYMRNQLLNDTDSVAMAHSLEVRVPLLDVPLLKAVAPWFAAHPQIDKSRAVQAAAPRLPREVLNKPKTGFNVPVSQWMQAPPSASAGGGMRSWARQVHERHAPPRGARVLLLATDAYGGHGGIAYYNRCLAEALASMPEVAEVMIVPRTQRFSPGAIPSKITYLQHASGRKRLYVWTVASLLRTRFDLIICGHIHLLPLAAPFALAKRRPLVLQVHGIDVWDKPSLMSKLALRLVDSVWSVSGVTRDRMNEWAKLAMTKYTIIPNTVNLAQYGLAAKREDLVARYGLQGRKVIMTLARLVGRERYKGIDEVLEAMPQLVQRVPSLSYLIMGDGDDRERLERKAEELGLSDRVIFTGFIEEDQKAAYLRLADVFVLPGRGEGFGIVYLEALACGTPVVGSTADGSREALMEGVLGELADPRDIESIGACIMRALAKPKAVPAALAGYDWQHYKDRVAQATTRALCEAPTL